MHELSIAMSIVDFVAEESSRLGAESVDAVHLKLGALSGVVCDALLFSFDLAATGTIAGGSRLVIEEVPVRIFCPQCQEVRPVPSIQQLCCEECGAPSSDIIQGQELLVTALEIRP
jgi:hydrogenase nickel incorporation protein HypA/HybF